MSIDLSARLALSACAALLPVAAACVIDVASEEVLDDRDEPVDEGMWGEDLDVPQAAGGQRSVRVTPGDTTDAELVKFLPVARKEAKATRKVVLSLRPSDLPGLRPGDVLITPAEVEVTTRCDVGQHAPGCDYNPHIRAQIILTGSPGDTRPGGDGSKALSEVMTRTCTKADHHCMFVFRPADTITPLTGAANLPCVARDSCYVNLVMWAWHRDARAGGVDKVLVGSNDRNFLENGKVEPDKARLMAVRERGIAPADRYRRESSGGGSLTMPLNANPKVIYSHKLKAGDGSLKKGEQYLIEAKVVTEVSGRARFSTQLVVAKDPKATSGGLDKIKPGAISEHNGINCTAGSSPCTTRKVAVFEVEEDINGPVFVNVVARSEVPGGGSARVEVKRNQGFVRSVRYGASLR